MSATETRNIVVLGASFGGLGVAHYIMRHVLPAANSSAPEGVKYKLCLVASSTQFFWRIGAPRAMVDTKLVKHADSFTPIADRFKQYTGPGHNFTFIHAEATSLDTDARTISLKPMSGDHPADTPLPYYAVVLATGTRTPTTVTSLHGDHAATLEALDAMNTRLRAAKTIVIAGGGPVAVESAGEIGEALNGTGGLANRKVTITLVAGGKKLLPVLRPALSDKAAALLRRVGVDVLLDVKVERAEQADGASTTVVLSNGTTLNADVYLPATGVEPNTAFVPAPLKSASGYIHTNATTLRVDAAGPRVFAVGDASDCCRGGVLNIQAAVPVVGANLKHDLLGSGPERAFKADASETQLVPVGRTKGVGAFQGWKLPGLMVYMIKGKDYLVGRRLGLTTGSQYSKE